MTPQAWDNVQVTQTTGGGLATLGGRLTVIMTGTFTPGTSFTLLHADAGRTNTFASYSIIPPHGGPCFTAVPSYDTYNVYLNLQTCE
jgi:hypothetical protein